MNVNIQEQVEDNVVPYFEVFKNYSAKLWVGSCVVGLGTLASCRIFNSDLKGAAPTILWVSGVVNAASAVACAYKTVTQSPTRPSP